LQASQKLPKLLNARHFIIKLINFAFNPLFHQLPDVTIKLYLYSDDQLQENAFLTHANSFSFPIGKYGLLAISWTL